MQENKVVAITGAAGFIGSNFVHYMHQNYLSYRLIGIDNLGIGSSSGSLSGLAENFKFINADIVDIGQILPLFKQEKVDYVVNFAAESHNDRAIANPSPFARTNAFGAQQILEASRLSGVQRHIHISTIEVYGEQGEQIPYFTETSPLNANTP